MIQQSIHGRQALNILALAIVLGVALLFPSKALAQLEVTTTAATEITSTTATLNGIIDTDGFETHYAFGYGTSTQYENITDLETIEPGAEAPVEVSAKITGLQPQTTYHFILGALGNNDNDEGEDLTFTTLDDHHPRFEAEEYPATIAGEQDAKDPLDLVVLGQHLKCETAQFDGQAAGATKSLALEAEYAGCKYGERNATVSMNSCNFVLNVANAGPPYTGTAAVACSSENDAIKVTIHDLPSAGLNCVVSIAPQTFGGSIGYENQGEGNGRTVRADLSTSDIVLKSEGTGTLCSAIGSAKGSFNGALMLEGLDEEDEQIGFFVDGEERFGLEVAGEASEEEANQPRFEAEEYPATIAGEQDPEDQLDFAAAGQHLKCETAQFDGQASAATKSLALEAEYSGCKYGVRDATVNMNSCHYALNVANAGPPYTGTAAVACSSENDAIKVTIHDLPSAGLNCVVSIAPQTFGGSIGYENQGEGNGRTVRADLATSGIVLKSEGTGVLCKAIGSAKGSLGGTIELGHVE